MDNDDKVPAFVPLIGIKNKEVLESITHDFNKGESNTLNLAIMISERIFAENKKFKALDELRDWISKYKYVRCNILCLEEPKIDGENEYLIATDLIAFINMFEIKINKDSLNNNITNLVD